MVEILEKLIEETIILARLLEDIEEPDVSHVFAKSQYRLKKLQTELAEIKEALQKDHRNFFKQINEVEK